MTTLKIFLTLTIIGLFTANPVTTLNDDDNPELVTLFTSALKSPSDNDLLKCLPTREDFVYLTELALKKEPNKVIPPVDSIVAEFPKAAIECLHRTLKKGSSIGIDWKSISVTNVTFKKENSKLEGIEAAEIILHYTDGHKNFTITLSDCMKIKQQWRLLDHFYLN